MPGFRPASSPRALRSLRWRSSRASPLSTVVEGQTQLDFRPLGAHEIATPCLLPYPSGPFGPSARAPTMPSADFCAAIRRAHARPQSRDPRHAADLPR
ncbi:MAG: hypothetical protein MZV64_15325 [Ignavibacteriales bacterium]|nr:hypothetical protein [Ignavibacteriales bacterium]